jgi:hypothetical protein
MGHQVLDVLCKKHLDAHIPKERAFDNYTNSTELLEVMLITCYEEQMSKLAVHLSEGAGPCRVDGPIMKEWLLLHKVSSKRLQEKMTHRVKWLSNHSTPLLHHQFGADVGS